MNTIVTAASMASASAVAAPSVIPHDNPDAELLALGAELRRLHAKEDELDAQISPLDWDAWETAEMETHICADDLSRLPKDDLKSVVDAYWVAAIANGKDELCKQDERLWNEITPVIEQIEALPAQTIAGIAVKALVAASTNKQIWQKDDWDDNRMQEFFTAIFAAAGMECPYKLDLPPKEPKPAPRPKFTGRIADENGFAPNVPVIEAINFHLTAWDAAKQLDAPGADHSNADNVVRTANNAVRAVDLATVENVHQAALRAVWIASYWNDPIHEEGGENAFPSLSAACYAFRQFLPSV